MRRYKKTGKRLLAIILSAMMTISTFSSAAFAEEAYMPGEVTTEEAATEAATEEATTEEATTEEAATEEATTEAQTAQEETNLPEPRASKANTQAKRMENLDLTDDANWKTDCVQNGSLWTNEVQNWSWDTASNTLALTGFAMENGEEGKYGIVLPADSNIVLQGPNTISSKSIGIYGNGSLHISGGGMLTVNIKPNSLGNGSQGIYAGGTSSDRITITGARLYLINQNTTKRAPSALDSQNAQVVVENADITIEGFESAVNVPFASNRATFSDSIISIEDSTRGINCGQAGVLLDNTEATVICTRDPSRADIFPVAISGSSIEINGSTITASSDGDSAIFTPGTLTVDNESSVNASGYYAGLQSNSSMILNGTIVSEGSDDNGIYTPDSLTIGADANVTATGNKYCGIQAKAGLTIEGTVTANSPNDAGIFTVGDMTIGETADITAVGKYAAIRANGSLEINGAKVTAESIEDVGIYGATSITFSKADAEIKAKGAVRALFKEPVLKDGLEETGGSWQSANAEVTYALGDCWKNFAATDFNGGTGTVSNPYQIATPEQLALLALNTNKGNTYANTYFQLVADIDLSAHRWNPIGTYRWEKNGTTINDPFSGFFDGNNKTITGLKADESKTGNHTGLFGRISDGGASGVMPEIKNLKIADALIISSEEGVTEANSGILSGSAMVNDGSRISIKNVTVSGTITNNMTDGNYHSGGMIGDAVRVDFTDCTADEIAISGGTNTGGFVGTDADSSFTGCKAAGSVSGSWSIGGFTGYSSSASLNEASASSYMNCSANVAVTGSDWRVGGFIGFQEGGTIKNSIAYGDVTSTLTGGWEPKAGGFVGENAGGTIQKSYAEGIVSNANTAYHAGGFTGFDEAGTTQDCMFDKTKNPTLSAVGAAGAAGTNDIKAGTTEENNIGICVDILDGHEFEEDVWSKDEQDHWNVCSVCQGKLNKAAHTWDKGVVTTAPTATQDGVKTYTCTVCDKTKTEKIKLVKISFKNLTANGKPGATMTTELTLTFDKDIEGLAKEDITIQGAEKGELTKTADKGVYKLEVGEFSVADGENITVSLSKDCFAFTPAQKDVRVSTIAKGEGYRFDGSTKVLTITSTEGTTSWRKDPTFGPNQVLTVVMQEGVTAIGQEAFNSCNYITSVTIPSTVGTIGSTAFGTCESLTSLYIPEGVTTIDFQAFLACKNMVCISIPSTVTSLGQFVMTGCYALQTVIVNGVTPANMGKNPFFLAPSTGTLYVPGESVEAYKAAANWNTYPGTIAAIPQNTTIQNNFTIGTASPVEDTQISDGTIISPAGAGNPVVTWSVYKDGVWEDAAGNFELNKKYRTIYKYTAEDGYIFDRSLTGAEVITSNLAGGTKQIEICACQKELTITVLWQKTEAKKVLPDFVAVTDITGVPTTAVAGTDLTLKGTVAPEKATNKTITWSIKDAGKTGATISGNKLKAKKTGTVVVRATVKNGKTDTTAYSKDFKITVKAVLSGIKVTTLPTKTKFVQGSTLSVAGGKLTATYSDGTKKVVNLSSSMVSGYNKNKVGSQKLTVTYEKKKTTFTVTVTTPKVTKIAWVKKPSKVQYLKGNNLSVSGGKIKVTYENKTTKNINLTTSMVSGYNKNKLGSQKLTVKYQGKTLTYNITMKVKAQWIHASKGWRYQNADGSYVTNQWFKDAGKWYHFDKKGYMQTGWLKIGQNWYYLKGDGARAAGWLQFGSTYYYMKSNGVMATDWEQVGSHWYYFYSSGSMAKSTYIGIHLIGSDGVWIPKIK